MKILKSFRTIFIICIIIAVSAIAFSGIYGTNNIDKLSYVLALGIDVGANNNIELSVQLAKPGGSSEKSGSSSQSSNNIVNSIECSSIESGINLFNSYISKKLNMGHCKVIVFSEEVASKGVATYLYTLLNSVEVSSQANIVVSKCSAKDFLEHSSPLLESLSSRYYDVASVSSEYTGYTQNISLLNFFSNQVDHFMQPVAILGSINTGDITNSSVGESSSNKSSPDLTNKDSSYKAGESPISSSGNLENMGLAVFRYDTLVGELTGLESICHLIISNDLKSCNISIPNPIGDSENLDINVRLAHKTKNSVQFVNGTPYISSNIKLKVKIISTTEDAALDKANYFTPEHIDLIEEACNTYLQKVISEYLYKTAKEYNADIDGFGKYAVKYFVTLQDWNDYNWLDNYQNSTFNVKVDSKVKSGYTFL